MPVVKGYPADRLGGRDFQLCILSAKLCNMIQRMFCDSDLHSYARLGQLYPNPNIYPFVHGMDRPFVDESRHAVSAGVLPRAHAEQIYVQ